MAEACVVLETANGVAQSPERYFLMGRSRRVLADTLENDKERFRNLRIAKAHLTRSIELNPRNAKPFIELDMVFQLLGERDAQLESADQCVKLGVWWQHRLQRPAHFVQDLRPCTPWHDPTQYQLCSRLQEHRDTVTMELLEIAVANPELFEIILYGDDEFQCREWRRKCPATAAVLDAFPSVTEAAKLKVGKVALLRLIPQCYHWQFTCMDHATSSEVGHNRCGPTNLRLTCHLPLVMHNGCTVQVGGGESREWTEGECIVFDDSFEHVLRNTANTGDAYVLSVQMWHPGVPSDCWVEYGNAWFDFSADLQHSHI